MTRYFSFSIIMYVLLSAIISNSFVLVKEHSVLLAVIIPAFILINIFAGTKRNKTRYKKLAVCSHGGVMLAVFLTSSVISVIFHVFLAFITISEDWKTFLWSSVYCIVAEGLLFWNGILCVCLCSSRLGIKLRVIGLICGMIPVVNLIVLPRIIKTVFDEIDYECKREESNIKRYENKPCKTEYPILLVHGVFFRDNKFVNYWGRIPEELELCGSQIYYGNHESASSIEDSARQLALRIKGIVASTGCEKLNIIAHSKGGLDCRYAIDKLDVAPYVASLTTVNTPHRGCQFADYLLNEIPENTKKKIESAYNRTLKRLGDKKPDFMAAVCNLTASFCEEFDATTSCPDGIYCQSIGSVLAKAGSGGFPLNLSYHLVRFFDGENDGLVSENSFKWGEKYTLVKPTDDKGISHADIIDLTRLDVPGFDVREFYIGLVSDLAERGL